MRTAYVNTGSVCNREARVPEEIPEQSRGSFGVVLVASLFLHLPESTLALWRARLALRVQGGSVLPDVVSMPKSGPEPGLFFEPAS